jgi:hypothetical protein
MWKMFGRGCRFGSQRIRDVLWVSGAEVGRGPIRSQPRRLRYDEYHIAAYLRRGRNVMSVLVTYYAPAWLSASPFQSTVATLPADIR